jgi:dihydropyrimidinase
MGILIKNATAVTDAERWQGDILCREGKIVALGPNLEPATGDEIVDAADQYVFPGGVDPHVHMELPVAGTVSSDDFETGTAAGLAGGTTTIIDFVHPERGQDPLDALAARQREAEKAVADYGFHMAVTWWGEEMARGMSRCVNEEGIPSFKAYMAYKETVGLEDEELVEVMATIADLEALLLVHAEHGDLVEHLRNRLADEGRSEPSSHPLSRPPAAEGEATHRAAVLADQTGASLYVVHVTCREAAAAIATARRENHRILGETCPQYLLLEDSVYDKPDFEGAAYVVSPPIRPTGHQDALWEAIANGDLQVVGTDHCPFHMHQKEAGKTDFRLIPGGAAGIEHRLPLLYTYGVGEGRFDLHRFVELVSTRPAKIFGLYPRKGSITVGADADLVIWDPEATATISARTHHHRCDRSIFEGFELRGLPSTVVARGVIRYRDGQLMAERGAGRFLERALPLLQST